MNPAEKNSDEITQEQNEINRTITNPLLQNMGSCSYYGLNHENEGQMDYKSIQYQGNKAQDINPYYDSNVAYKPPFDETPAFQNTSEIHIKQKVKIPKKAVGSQSQHKQEYIKFNKDNNGNYSKQVVSRNESDCCNGSCCDQACIQCCFQVCLTVLCELIFKR